MFLRSKRKLRETLKEYYSSTVDIFKEIFLDIWINL